jgi:urea transport system substrate-binding protein
MLIILGVACILLFGIIYVLLDRWEESRAQIIWLGLIVALFLVGAPALLRYRLSHFIGCVPSCAGANFVGRDFQGLQLDGVTFTEANFSNANLAEAQLVGTDFAGANLRAVNLERANLADSNFAGANLIGANLVGANLVGANFSGADLSQAYLTGVDLTSTNLRGVQLIEAELIGVNLTGAQMNSVNLTQAKMNGARLANANLSGAILSGADLSGAFLVNIRLSGAWLNLSDLIGASLMNADLSGSSMIGADLASADLGNSSLVSSNLIGANFRGANLQGADLRGVRVEVADLAPEEIQRDPVLAELNELQRSQIFADAQLDGGNTVGSQVEDAQSAENDSPTEALPEVLPTAAGPIAAEESDPLLVGVLLDGRDSLLAPQESVGDGILLAINEINAAGGVLGRTVVPMVDDGGAAGGQDVDLFSQRLSRLLEGASADGRPLSVIFGGFSSEARKAALPLLAEADTLLFYPYAYEGFEESSYVIYTGPDPAQIVIPAVEYLLAQGHVNFGLLGADTLYSRTVNRIIQAQLEAAGVNPASETYLSVTENMNSSTDFGPLFRQMELVAGAGAANQNPGALLVPSVNPSMNPSVIISTLLGQQNADFYAQMSAAGLSSDRLPVLNLTLSEVEIRAIGPELLAGHLVASSYFQTSQTADNPAFVAAFKRAYGDSRVTADAAASGYSAVYLWKSLVEAAQSTQTDALRATLRQAETQTGEGAAINPKGALLFYGGSQQLAAYARLGVIRPDGLIEEIVVSSAPLAPDPFLSQFGWAAAFPEWPGPADRRIAPTEQ